VATVTIDILNKPTTINSTFATDDSFFVKENNPMSGNVLTNDNDPEGDIQTVNIVPVVLPVHGTLVLNANGTVSYTPALNYIGLDRFVYEVCDNGTPTACDKGTVYLIIAPVNYIPVAIDDKNITNEDTSVNGNVSTNDIPSADGGNVWTMVSQPKDGKVVMNTDGTYTYTPNADFNGTDTFTYKVCDVNGDCDEALVSVTVLPVDDSPVANDDLVSFHIDDVLNDWVTDNDAESGDGGNVWSIVTQPTRGTITFNIDGSYTYTPGQNFVGNDTFTYKLCDADGDCDEASVTISVEDVVLPNQVLTPNGDTHNDTFIINGIEFYPENDLTIYNRWGNKVYQKSGYLNEWDGISNENKVGSISLPVGTYFYVLKYGNQRHKTGYVYLDR
jgi:gliding motility-associated-like protein